MPQKKPKNIERYYKGGKVVEKTEDEDEIYSVTFRGQGEGNQDLTIFDKEQIKRMPASVFTGQNVEVLRQSEKARLDKLTPMERYNEMKEKEYSEGKYGSFTAEELNARFQQEGRQPTPEEEEIIRAKTGTQKAAEFGVAPAVGMANLISRGLSLVGVDIGTITREQFASTTIGKTLGLGTVGAEVVAAGAVAGYALALLPSGIGAEALGTVGAARAVTAGSVVKTGLMSKLASSTLLKLALGGGVTAVYYSATSGKVSNLETSIVNQRETLTLIGSAVDAGAITRSEAMLLFDEIENSINNSDAAIQKAGIFDIRFRLSNKSREVQTRIEKARTQLLVERAKLMQPQGL